MIIQKRLALGRDEFHEGMICNGELRRIGEGGEESPSFLSRFLADLIPRPGEISRYDTRVNGKSTFP